MVNVKKIGITVIIFIPILSSNALIIEQNHSPNFLPRYDEDSHEKIIPTLLVLHYTAEPLKRVQEIFAQADVQTPVSSHYTVDSNGAIYQHVAESLAARHTGVAYWKGIEGPEPLKKKLNLHSIGIEQVNMGFRVNKSQPKGILVKGSDKEWYPFDEREIESTIALCKYILARNKQIKPYNIIAHSDIAPGRKLDPGPLFPWKKLAEHGIGVWPDIHKIKNLPCIDTCRNDESKKDWFMRHLNIWGYRLPDEDVTSEDIVRSFQMHFRPENIDGLIDQESIDILRALISEHRLSDNYRCPCLKP